MNAYRPVAADQRAIYRRYIRENHPDVGGDPDAFAAGLTRLRAAHPRPPDRYDATVEFVSDAERTRRRLHRLWRRWYRRGRLHRVL